MINLEGMPREGFGMYDIFLLTRAVSSIEIALIDFFEGQLGKKLMIDDLKVKLGLTRDDKDEKLEEEMLRIEKKLNSFNEAIKDLNENVLKTMGISKKISNLNVQSTCKVIKEKLTYQHKEGMATLDLVNKNFHFLLSQEIGKVISSIEDLGKFFKENEENFKGVNELKGLGLGDVAEAININSIGYGKTAVLCMGRAIEGLINAYIKKLFEKGIISEEDFNEFIDNKYNNKTGFLKSNGIFNEEEFTKLKGYAFDRDKGGHPDLGDIDINRSKTLIQQGIWLIIDLQKKIESTKSDAEIALEKAEDLLGGKAKWSGPILYGTPQEKLKQLEGYEGGLIEEIREKLKKEIEDSNKKL